MMRKTKEHVFIMRMILAAFCLSAALLLPFLTGQIPQIGSKLLPMHIPVLLCGFLCGGPWGLAVGFIAPLLRNLMFGMPPLFPTGVGMAFELAAYGFFTGFLSRIFPRKIAFVYLNLILSMIIGRLVWGIVRFFISGFAETSFTFTMFMTGAIIDALPGIAIQIVLIPLIIIALKRTKVEIYCLE